MMRSTTRAGRLGLLVVATIAAGLLAGTARAAPPPEPVPQDGAPTSGSLIQVPFGCPTPEPAAVVFTGRMVGKDDLTETVRFGIEEVRAGSADPWGSTGLIDIRYGPDYRFLVEGETYLVGAGIDSRFNVLASTVRPPEPTFGGNDVVGVDDLALECPDLDDPIRTLNVDGTSVDSGVLSLITQDRRLLLATILVPLGIGVLALLALVLVRKFGAAALRGTIGLGRAAVTPVTDHRATRVRSHGPRDVVDWTSTSQNAGRADDAASGSDTSDPAAVAPRR